MKYIITFMMLYGFSRIASADEYSKMVKITCAPAVGIFELQATGNANIGDFGWHGSQPEIEKLAKENGLFLSGRIDQSCVIPTHHIRVQINYREPRPKGNCGGNPGAELNAWVNDINVLNNVPFAESCHDTSIYFLKFDANYITACGGKDFGLQTCVVEDIRSKTASTVVEKLAAEISAQKFSR